MKTAIIVGTSRTEGNTTSLVNAVAEKIDAEVYNLDNFTIAPFSYKAENDNDDFLGLMNTLLKVDCIVFASPVYWYSPSAQMKTFLDRLTDLLTHHKTLGRALRKKSSALISTGNDEAPAACFEDIFRMSFNYLGMNYKGMLYCACPENFEPQGRQHKQPINQFIGQLIV